MNLEETYEIIKSWEKDKIINVIRSSKKGFNTQLMGKDLLYWTKRLLKLSKAGLEKRDIIIKNEKNETLFKPY